MKEEYVKKYTEVKCVKLFLKNKEEFDTFFYVRNKSPPLVNLKNFRLIGG